MPALLILLALCYIFALQSNHTADFSPINGTFQNYNPVRRFLAGQLPYRDFQDYLGLGHLYLGSLFTWLFGGSYHSSLVAFSFLCAFSLGLVSLAMGWAILENLSAACWGTNLLIILLVLNGGALPFDMLPGIDSAVLGSFLVGNSARGFRGMVLSLLCLLLMAAFRLLWPRLRQSPHAGLLACVGTGLLGGAAFLWSNDYGISCWVCLMLMVLIAAFCRTKKPLKALLCFLGALGSCFISAFILAFAVTHGHPGRWFSATFGVGGYQSWYYLSLKHFYIYEIDHGFLLLLQAFVCLFYLVQLWRANGSGRALVRYGVPAFANMACFCAANEYWLLSGNSLHEVAFSVLFFTGLYEACRVLAPLFERLRPRRALQTLSLLLGLALMGSIAWDEVVFWQFTEKGGRYFEEMGGYLTQYGGDLTLASEFLEGDAFFSTYASAQEVVEDKFQPSGTDYLIHVLGDAQRQQYLDAFRAGDFRYVSTILPRVSAYDSWLQRANWFFFRELYQGWHPVFCNDYQLYWERNTGAEQPCVYGNFKVEILPIDAANSKLILKTDPSVNGTAEILLDYAIFPQGGLRARLLYQTMLLAGNPQDNVNYSYLRSAGSEYIPLEVVDGYGELSLISLPAQSTRLEVYSASCNVIYPIPYSYAEVLEVKTMEDGRTALIIAQNPNSDKAAHSADALLADGVRFAVDEVQFDSQAQELRIVLPSTVPPGAFTFESLGGHHRNFIQLIREDA